MQTYFNIRYEFDRNAVHAAIHQRLGKPGADYISVADGVILDTANRVPEYLDVVNSGMFAICDSSYVPLYIRMIHGKRYSQYCGSEIFRDIISSRRYRMIFLGPQQPVLDSLQKNLISLNPDVSGMQFIELPFRAVEDFDYPAIAKTISEDGADIIWIALGAPKQEKFIAANIDDIHGTLFCGLGGSLDVFAGGARRAPDIFIKLGLEWFYRLLKQPSRIGRMMKLPKFLLVVICERLFGKKG